MNENICAVPAGRGTDDEKTAYITKKPARSGKTSIPDGALCGNGDLSVILGSSGSGMRLYISKCDFWIGDEDFDKVGGITPFGYFDIDVPQKLYDNYYAEQRMGSGEVFASFKNADEYFNVKIDVCAVKNAILVEIENSQGIDYQEPVLRAFEGTVGENSNYDYKGIPAVSRKFDYDGLWFKTHGVAGVKKLEGEKKRYLIYVATNHESPDFETSVLDELLCAGGETFERLYEAHLQWWKNFWAKSWVKLDDKEIQLNWCASQYILAICARNNEFPPGLYGNFTTIENVNWKGDYHLNYNYQAPFYALCSSNHIELTDCYSAPIEAFVPKGKENARRIGCGGIYYPVGIGPKGMYTELRQDAVSDIHFNCLFLGQKSDAVHAADIMIFRWYASRDEKYAREHLYPYLKECAAFFDDYLKEENGVYNIYQDSIHEVPYYMANFKARHFRNMINDTNNLLTLGLLRMMYKALIDISQSLGEDEARRKKWAHILEHLPPFSTQRKKLKKVFRYTSKGTAWNKINFLCLQHVYPAGAIGLDSDKELFETARNTFFINDRWDDENAINSVYPCAARLGINPDIIIKRMKNHFHKFLLENRLFVHGGGCLENNSFVAATVNEMLLQGFEGVVRLFPCWNKKNNCSFYHLRADGAFLVSASLCGGEIKGAEIFSEAGRPLTLENPFDKCEINGKVFAQRRFTIQTKAGQTYKITKA